MAGTQWTHTLSNREGCCSSPNVTLLSPKASGLRHLLDTLGASVHNAIALGDAENDHELLTCCEYGVAVSWGSARLQEIADHVIEGEGPQAVANYVDQVSTDICLPTKSTSHRKVILEEIEGHAPFEMLIRGRNVLVAGDSKSGKSWLAGLLVEQQILQGYTIYAFDPEGDYSSLASLPNTVVLGGGRMVPRGDDLKMLLQQGISVVLNLSHLEHDEKREYIHQHLPLVAQHRRERGYPHRILLDECHYFLNGALGERLLDNELEGYPLVLGNGSTSTTRVDSRTPSRAERTRAPSRPSGRRRESRFLYQSRWPGKRVTNSAPWEHPCSSTT